MRPCSEDERKALEPLVSAADGIVAFVFGAEGRADPLAIDALRRPWWAVYSAAAGRGAPPAEPVAERYLERLLRARTPESISRMTCRPPRPPSRAFI